MADKFDKMSIYDIEWKTLDNEGVEQSFIFKPLPFLHYPKVYKLLNGMQSLKFEEGLSDEDKNKKLLETITKNGLLEDLLSLEKIMVSNSYPDLKEDKVDLFVTSNVFSLMEPLFGVINRQEKTNPRKVAQYSP